MAQAGNGRLSKFELAAIIDRKVGTVLTMVSRGVLPPYDPDDYSWDADQLDDLKRRVAAFQERGRARRAASLQASLGKAREAKRKKREAGEAAQVGRLTRVELGRLVKRSEDAIRLWVKRGDILDSPDADGTWPAGLKDRLVAQARAFKLRDKQRRRGHLMNNPPTPTKQKSGDDFAPRKVADYALARSHLKMLSEHFDGNEKEAMKFLEAFSGITLRMPAAESVERLRCEQIIERAVRRDPSTGCLRRMADHHGLAGPSAAAKVFSAASGLKVRELRASMAAEVSTDDLHNA